MGRSPLPCVLATLLLAVPTAAQEVETLDQAIWSIPALRSLRNTVRDDSLLAPAFEACRSAALGQQRRIAALLRGRADDSPAAAADSLRDVVARYEAIPVTQLEARCLLASADSLPGLVNRPGTLARLEEVVGLLRSGRMAPAGKAALRDVMAAAATVGGSLDDLTVHRELEQRPIHDFLETYAAREAALRPPPPPSRDSSRGPVPVKMTLAKQLPTKSHGKSIDVIFTVEASGEVSAIAIIPEITDSSDWRSMIESLRQYRFKPALDSQGRPIRGTYQFSFVIGWPPRKP